MDVLLALAQMVFVAMSWPFLALAEGFHALGRAFWKVGDRILTQKFRMQAARQARKWRWAHRRSFLVVDRFEPMPEKECKLLRRRIDLEETLKEVWR